MRAQKATSLNRSWLEAEYQRERQNMDVRRDGMLGIGIGAARTCSDRPYLVLYPAMRSPVSSYCCRRCKCTMHLPCNADYSPRFAQDLRGGMPRKPVVLHLASRPRPTSVS